MDAPAPNPLLSDAPFPAFGDIQPVHVMPAVRARLARAEAALEQAVGAQVPDDFDALSRVLDVATEGLERTWSLATHLNAVANTPELRAAYNEALGPVTAFHTKLGADERLYAKVRAIALSGAALQGLLRNPLADPGVLGVSASAGLGAGLTISLGLAAAALAVEGAALGGALACGLLVTALAARFRTPEALILMGVSLSV